MRIVVTGGAGYIGSILVPNLLAAGHEVHVLDNLMFGAHAIIPLFIHKNFSFAEVDVTDPKALAPHLKDADAVVHLAALVGYPLCKKMPKRAVEVNLDGARYVADLTPPDAHIVYASTGSNYGEVVGICTEDTPLNPLSLYGETKTKAEYLFLERPKTVSLRFATAFGIAPRIRLDLMINDFAYQAIHNRFLVIYEKHFRRTFIHIQDIARAIQFMTEDFGRLHHSVYNVGHDSMNYTKEDIVNLIKHRTDFLAHFAEIGTDDDKRDYEVSYERVRSEGFEISVDIDRGLDEVIGALRYLRIRNPYSNV
ncbi:MAG: NAD-dependent epimerase/dehydratase [Alphaproteobacteria bacterium]|nr:NAD-dependent epimerase/dehydratase [Alphaproteobacteria bacterium]